MLETVSVESTSSSSQSHGHQLSGAAKRPKVSGTSHGTPQCLMGHQSSTSHDAETTSKAAPARIAFLQRAAATRRTTTRTNKNIKAARTKQRTSRGSDPDGTLLSSRLGQEHFFFHKQHRHDLDLLNHWQVLVPVHSDMLPLPNPSNPCDTRRFARVLAQLEPGGLCKAPPQNRCKMNRLEERSTVAGFIWTKPLHQIDGLLATHEDLIC